MSKTETSDLAPADALTVTVPSDPAPSGAHAAVMHTPVNALTSAPLLAGPVGACGHADSAMPDVQAAAAVPVSSADQL